MLPGNLEVGDTRPGASPGLASGRFGWHLIDYWRTGEMECPAKRLGLLPCMLERWLSDFPRSALAATVELIAS